MCVLFEATTAHWTCRFALVTHAEALQKSFSSYMLIPERKGGKHPPVQLHVHICDRLSVCVHPVKRVRSLSITVCVSCTCVCMHK